jgi:hypothetical protein
LFQITVISEPELPGFGMIFPDPDPANSSGSDRIRIRNTGALCNVPVVPEVNWILKGASIWMMFVSWLTLLRAVVPAPCITSLNEWQPLNNKPEPITLNYLSSLHKVIR